jgi:ABC-type multidrug transport system ATPase subunit
LKKEADTSLILTTHYMEEAEQLCDYIVIIDKGKILREGTLRELLGYDGADPAGARLAPRRKTLDDLFTELTGRHLDE